jgi:hypothetical protein
VPVPVAAVPPPVALVPPVPVAGVTAALEDEESAADEEDAAEAVSVAVAEVVEVVELDWVEVAGNEALAWPVVGTVSGGAPDVSALDGVELLPQAASPRAARMPKSSAARVAIERLMGAYERTTLRSRAAPYACRSSGSR